MEQKVRLPYDDIRAAFEEGGYLPIFCQTSPDQHVPEMVHMRSAEFGPASIDRQEEGYYADDDQFYDDDPAYQPPFDPNGVTYTFYLPKRAELCALTICETRDGGTLVSFAVSDAYEPAFSIYLDSVAARYHAFIDDMRLLARGLAAGHTLTSFIAYKRQQASAARSPGFPQPPQPPVAGAAQGNANGAPAPSEAPAPDETVEREQEPIVTSEDAAPQPRPRLRQRPEEEERDQVVLAIYHEHPDWPQYRIKLEAQERAPQHTFTEHSVRNAFRRHKIQRRRSPKRTR